jgi:myo-inositol 2-dehydrogenase / D-chiro-inositol 1-dehydrogenase
MTSRSVPARVAVSGCGAVTQLYYAPALRTLEREGLVRVVAAHDPDAAARRRFCDAFPAVRAAHHVDGLLGTSPDLVIVASPPQHHAEQAIAVLAAGIDVHCEKPLAPTRADGDRMVAAAEAAGRTLTVGMVRRQLPATIVIRELLASGAIGPLEAVECFEGGPFAWPIRSAGYFRTENGGVLQDIGTHCLDLLLWWLGPPSTVEYEDDSLGGVEANCRIGLTFGEVPATIRLSRDWPQENRYLITGRDGRLSWTVNDGDRLLHEVTRAGVVADQHLRPAASPSHSPSRGRFGSFHRAFVDQLVAVVAPCDGGPIAVSGAEALATTALVERCAAVRRPMPMPWLLPDGAP